MNKENQIKKKELSYIKWEPAISPEEVFSDVVELTELQVVDDKLYWIEVRPYENGRYVLVDKSPQTVTKDAVPSGFNVRTRVHEYGGGAYAAFENSIYFVNFKDQRIYHKIENSSEIRPFTPVKNKDGSSGKYASLTVSPDGKKLLFVYEKEYSNKENEDFLGILELDSKDIAEPTIIAKGYDFYADPVFSPEGDKIAWLQWNHPYMPWDSTELIIADFKENILVNIRKVNGGENKSVCLPKFDKKGRLYYVMDKKIDKASSFDNWWNIYRYDDGIERITSERGEFGKPHWVFGQSSYDFLPDGRIIAKMIKEGEDALVVIEPENKTLSFIDNKLSAFSSIKADKKGKVFFVGASSKKPQAICSIDTNSDLKEVNIIKKSSKIEMRNGDTSLPENIKYPTKDGKEAYAFLYMPKNSISRAPEDEKPPLLVIVHGGPTSSTCDSFSFLVQFWTSSGFAVIDINYRGSTGFGRRYRDALLSNWGIIDAEDVADGVRYLIKENKIDPEKVAVRGGSAGGYMVQRVMTQYPELFKVGASYYGIGDLITLVEQTHKFESHYIDNLIGAKLPEGESEYKRRSPINHLDRLKAPMIIFQGSEDKIVIPKCSQEVAEKLKEKGIKYDYIEYEGEQHGFRSKKSKVDSLMREFRFYREVFG